MRTIALSRGRCAGMLQIARDDFRTARARGRSEISRQRVVASRESRARSAGVQISSGDSRRLNALWKWRHLARHIAAARNPSPREVVSFRRDALANYAGPTPTQIVVGLPSEPLLGFAVTARLFWAVLKASATPVPHRLAPSE